MPGHAGQWEIVIAGSIYWAQAEALDRVAQAVRLVAGTTLTVIGDPRLRRHEIDADRYECVLRAAPQSGVYSR